MKLRIVQVDAFADRPFTGNPAAVMPLEGWLADDTLQAIAAENNLSETAFLVPDTSGDADYELRWFTPTVEVVMCGHATLASGHVLLADRPELEEVRFRTRSAGLLRVARRPRGYALDLPAWAAAPKPLPEMAAGIGGTPSETLWRDGGYALFVYGSEAEVRALVPNFRALARHGDILFVATAPGETTDIASRVFVPGGGIDEDPVTGSAHALLAPYWAARLGRDSFTALQASPREGRMRCRLAGDRVVIEAGCVTVMEGSFLLP